VRRFSLDSNLLVYAVDGRDPQRREAALAIIAAAAASHCVLTLQALGEFFHVATRKRIIPAHEAAGQVGRWMVVFPDPVAAGPAALRAAMAASSRGHFGFWDAVLLATAREAGCDAVISEDMADGAMLDGVHVVGAFAGTGIAPEARRLLGLG
jgi:predicted nucleic acid-binding protein